APAARCGRACHPRARPRREDTGPPVRKYHAGGYRRVIVTRPHRTDHRHTEPAGIDLPGLGPEQEGSVSTDDRAPDTVRGTYRALLHQGLEPDEAADVTCHLYGLPSAGIRWTVDEVEAIVRRRAAHLRSQIGSPSLDELAVASPRGWELS